MNVEMSTVVGTGEVVGLNVGASVGESVGTSVGEGVTEKRWRRVASASRWGVAARRRVANSVLTLPVATQRSNVQTKVVGV